VKKKIARVFEKHSTLLLTLWLVILFVLYSLLSILRHNHFQSGGFDLGLYDQGIWQYSRFLYPYNTIKERLILGDHLNLTLPLLGPLFYLWNNVKILLLFQSFCLTFSSLAVYLLAKKRNYSNKIALAVAFIYSFFYGLQQAVFFDFHPVVIATGLIPWLAYFFENKKTRLTVITTVLLLATQENMGLALVGLGCFYLFNKTLRKGAFLFILSGAFFTFAAVKATAALSPIGFEYQPEITLNPIKNLIELFNNPEKRQVWFYSFAWFSFLPLLSPGALIAVTIDLSQYFVTGNEFARMWSPFMHHRAILAPFLALGTLEALSLFKKRINLNYLAVLLVAVSLFLQYFFHFPLNKLIKPNYWQNEAWMSDNQTIFREIPSTASLAAQQNLIPHLSHRKEIYLIWPRAHDFDNNLCGQRSCWWLDFGGHPEYLVVDLHPNQWLTQLLESNENFNSAINNMEKTGKIKLIKQVNEARLYKITY